MKEKFDIGGMTCSACAAHVEKAVNKLDVNFCSVNLLTNSMEVDFDTDKESIGSIISAVEKQDIVQKNTRIL